MEIWQIFLEKQCDIYMCMVLTLDDSLEYYANNLGEMVNFVCLRLFITSTVASKLTTIFKKTCFSLFVRNQFWVTILGRYDVQESHFQPKDLIFSVLLTLCFYPLSCLWYKSDIFSLVLSLPLDEHLATIYNLTPC